MRNRFAFGLASLALVGIAHSQTLTWQVPKQAKPAKCLYGEVTVWVTKPGSHILFNAAEWNIGLAGMGRNWLVESGGGEARRITTIFYGAPKNKSDQPLQHFCREGNESVGIDATETEPPGHYFTNPFLWPDRVTYRFLIEKKIFEGMCITNYWQYSDAESVAGGIDASTGKPVKLSADKEWVPFYGVKQKNVVAARSFSDEAGKLISSIAGFADTDNKGSLATFSLWIGPTPNQLKRITAAKSDSPRQWGIVGDDFYLWSGSEEGLVSTFLSLVGVLPTGGSRGEDAVLSVSDRDIPEAVKRTLPTPLPKPKD